MTTPPPEPEHTGLRPLSPWGEGYCRYCHFVVGLTYDGLLVFHSRGAQLHSDAVCKGGGTKAPKVTPHSSRKAAFTTKSEKVGCHVCGREVHLLVDGRMTVHSPSVSTLTRCPGGYHQPERGSARTDVPQRDHGSERG